MNLIRCCASHGHTDYRFFHINRTDRKFIEDENVRYITTDQPSFIMIIRFWATRDEN